MDSKMGMKLLEAMHYEKMAVLTLLPEQGAKHVETIEQEIKAMVLECVTEKNTEKATEKEPSDKKESSRVKKVVIDWEEEA